MRNIFLALTLLFTPAAQAATYAITCAAALCLASAGAAAQNAYTLSQPIPFQKDYYYDNGTGTFKSVSQALANGANGASVGNPNTWTALQTFSNGATVANGLTIDTANFSGTLYANTLLQNAASGNWVFQLGSGNTSGQYLFKNSTGVILMTLNGSSGTVSVNSGSLALQGGTQTLSGWSNSTNTGLYNSVTYAGTNYAGIMSPIFFQVTCGATSNQACDVAQLGINNTAITSGPLYALDITTSCNTALTVSYQLECHGYRVGAAINTNLGGTSGGATSAKGYAIGGKLSSTINSSATATITSGSAVIATSVANLSVPAYYIAGTPIVFSATVGTGGGGVVAGTTYYVLATGLTTSTIEVSGTLNGTPITFNASGTATAVGSFYNYESMGLELVDGNLDPTTAYNIGLSISALGPSGGAQVVDDAIAFNSSNGGSTNGYFANYLIDFSPAQLGSPVTTTTWLMGAQVNPSVEPAGVLDTHLVNTSSMGIYLYGGATSSIKFANLPTGTPTTYACFTSAGVLVSSATAC